MMAKGEEAAMRAVSRAVAELRRGDPVALRCAGGALLAAAAENAGAALLERLAALGAAPPGLVLGAGRAAALGVDAPDGAVRLEGPLELALRESLGDPVGSLPLPLRAWAHRPADAAETAAVLLAKLARLLPAAVTAPAPAGFDPAAADILAVDAAAVFAYRRDSALALRRVGAARVPLEGAEDARIVAFRAADGGVEHLAIVVGDPPGDRPVLARLHSACLTGDILGSLRCDCGEQLRGAIHQIAAEGGGVLLYLAQEGRDIGLVNKLRAYALQDGGLDTVDANLALGFAADERLFEPAAAMLRQLGFSAVRLMTNNPDKVAQLAACGIAVTERVPHAFPANGHNEAYLRTKKAKSGHLL